MLRLLLIGSVFGVGSWIVSRGPQHSSGVTDCAGRPRDTEAPRLLRGAELFALGLNCLGARGERSSRRAGPSVVLGRNSGNSNYADFADGSWWRAALRVAARGSIREIRVIVVPIC